MKRLCLALASTIALVAMLASCTNSTTSSVPTSSSMPISSSSAVSSSAPADSRITSSTSNIPAISSSAATSTAMLTAEDAEASFAQAHPGIEVKKVELQTGDSGREQYFVLGMQDGFKYKYIIDAYDGTVILDKTIKMN